jgi:hypothetical protein
MMVTSADRCLHTTQKSEQRTCPGLGVNIQFYYFFPLLGSTMSYWFPRQFHRELGNLEVYLNQTRICHKNCLKSSHGYSPRVCALWGGMGPCNGGGGTLFSEVGGWVGGWVARPGAGWGVSHQYCPSSLILIQGVCV